MTSQQEENVQEALDACVLIGQANQTNLQGDI